MHGTRRLAMIVLAGAAHANETITYTYDALGRVTQVNHAGTVNPGLQSAYGYDLADNRLSVTVTGSPHALALRAAQSQARKKAAPRKGTARQRR